MKSEKLIQMMGLIENDGGEEIENDDGIVMKVTSGNVWEDGKQLEGMMGQTEAERGTNAMERLDERMGAGIVSKR